MPRIARVVLPGIPHHVTQRGNRKLDVFWSSADCQKFLQLVFQYSRRYSLAILAYCLMQNHVHFICIPFLLDTLALVFRPVFTRYTQFFNVSHSIGGRLWQGRFFSCPMDEEHLWAAIRYVERNPVRAGIVRSAGDYPWSSASAHCGLRDDPLLFPIPASRVLPDQWSDWLANPEDDAVLSEIRRHTQSGKPLRGTHTCFRSAHAGGTHTCFRSDTGIYRSS